MSSFIHEDGQGNKVDDHGNGTMMVNMEDNDVYSLENIPDLAQYLDVKAELIEEEPKVEVVEPPKKVKKTYRSYCPEDKEHFFFLIYEKNMGIRKAARSLKIPETTAQNWYKKETMSPEEVLEKKKNSRPVGRPRIVRQ
ncbi:hypothetical protein BDB01DRAFT_849175 [Pilobolus umbonatus]|nr:hypothetical protein BDB01DRAFT_849175 [Pilobolus umbonatus]